MIRRTSAILLMAAAAALPLGAASTGTSSLHMPQGTDAGTANGDYLSDEDAINGVYRYFIEVPPGLNRLVVQIFDPDIGAGANEDDAGRDRNRAGGWDGEADYTLIRPDGSTAATLLNCDDNTCGNDNAWATLLDSTTATNTAAGHWELRVDMDNGDEINAMGVRAHDGNSGSGGTELNVYLDSMVSLGVNPDPGSNSRSYTHYPWVTSGCQCSQNDFDRDTNNGDTGSVTYRTRTGVGTGTDYQTFASGTLSGNNAWNRDNLTRWGDDDDSTDYGIWRAVSTISTYNTPGVNGNYETWYVGSHLAAANPPTANPIVSGGNPAAFRLYLPTDAGAAPVKPYMEQLLTHNRNFTGPNPPQVGLQTVYTVTVRIVNPTPYSITFSASNLVTANVPGGAVLYGGGAQISQGSITSQPSVGGSGNVTWNPGTVTAGSTVLLSYNIRVTPTSGTRIAVTGTPASNGTRAQYVDETGNTTQSRATYLMGGICELAVTVGALTEAMISQFEAVPAGSGTNIRWTTSSEAGTIGFNVYRASGEKVNESLIPSSLRPDGDSYELTDSAGSSDSGYIIEEINAQGHARRTGPMSRFEGVSIPARRPLVTSSKRDQRNALRSESAPADGINRGRIAAAMAGVRETGVVRLTADGIAAALGVPPSDVVKAIAKGGVQVTSRGASVAWTTIDGASILFFGEKSDSIYSQDRVYRVELSKGTTMNGRQVAGASSSLTSFTDTLDIESDAFAATVLPLNAESDYWFWQTLMGGSEPAYASRAFAIDVPSVASSSGATLTVRLQGAYNSAHRAFISLNGVRLGDAAWSAFGSKSATFSIPASVLRNGANEILVEAAAGPELDIFYIDGFALTYQRQAAPVGGRIQINRGGAVTAGPFSAAPLILDITRPLEPVRLTGGTFMNGIAGVSAPSNAQRLYFAETFVAPSFIRSSWDARLDRRERSDWVVITPRDWVSAAETLARTRGRDGLSTLVVELEQIYDEFAGGNATPHAVRDYIRAVTEWKHGPRYFVLAGTGSVDYRGIYGRPNPMPPLMTTTPDGIFAADSLFTDLNGDKLPDTAIGRIPVSTAGELLAYAAKLDAYSGSGPNDTPLVFSADMADPGMSFTSESSLAAQPLDPRPTTRIDVDTLGPAGARSALFSAWSTGPSLVSWTGHGGLDRLSAWSVLASDDAPSLTSGSRLPVLVAMTCTINRFENGFVDPVGVALTREVNGGALAVWSASGLSKHHHATAIQTSFMKLANAGAARIGDLVIGALAANPNDTASIYLLLGDPAVRLHLPSAPRPVPQPVASNE